MTQHRPPSSGRPERHLVAAAATGDRDRFATLVAPDVRGGPGAAAGRRDVPQLPAQCGGRRRAGLGAERQPVRGHARPRAHPSRPIPGSSPSRCSGSGRAAVAQDGRHCMLGPGDLVNYVTSRPYEVTFWEPYEVVVVTVPLAALGLAHRHPRGADRDRGRDGSRPPRRRRNAPRRASPRRSTAAPRVTRAAARSTSRTRSSRWSSPSWSTSSRRAQATTSPTACSPTAWRTCPIRGSPSSRSARALGVSVRYLHKVLAPTGKTLSAWIRRQRLERIGRDLADESLRGRTAGAIAARWGMPDTGHLSRALKAEFGMTASEIRRSGRWERGGPRPLTERPRLDRPRRGHGLTGRHRQSPVDTTVPHCPLCTDKEIP